jgi:hypothetical protein
VTLQLGNPSFVAAAGLLIAFGMLAAVWNLRVVNSPDEDRRAANTSPGLPTVPTASPFSGSSETYEPLPAGVERTAVQTSSNPRPVAIKADHTPNARPRAVTLDYSSYMTGEESYVKTIATLSESVDEKKDNVLTPTARVAYERDMAIVNDAIKKMKAVVKKNPRNASAKQVLYSSYQNKIDLLNSVAEREELMASVH